MRSLEGSDVLALWERGSTRHALDRSALLVAWARPELPVERIADLPLGEITQSLLRLRAASFGQRIHAHVDCAGCGERLALTLAIDALLDPQAPGAAAVPPEAVACGLRCRPPCLRDLAAVAHERDAEDAARRLLARCLLDAPADAAALPEATLQALENALEAADPYADLLFDVRCEACGHRGSAQLDAGQLLWDELETRARALLGEVHRLACAYGWSEGEILALSPARRAAYLAMAGA